MVLDQGGGSRRIGIYEDRVQSIVVVAQPLDTFGGPLHHSTPVLTPQAEVQMRRTNVLYPHKDSPEEELKRGMRKM